MALRPCKECGNQISTAAASCPQCGAPNVSEAKQNKLANGLLGGAGILVLIGFLGWQREGQESSAPSSPAQSSKISTPFGGRTAVMPNDPASGPISAIPAAQQNFIGIIEASRRAYKAATNDLAKGSTRPTRAQGLCASMPNTAVNNWVGIIANLSSNSDGDGVLGVSIGENVSVKTWNNSFSDISDSTILNHNSEVYRKASNLSVGQKVRFSGSLIRSQVDCFKEGSLSMSGAMNDPEFIFRFGSIEPM